MRLAGSYGYRIRMADMESPLALRNTQGCVHTYISPLVFRSSWHILAQVEYGKKKFALLLLPPPCPFCVCSFCVLSLWREEKRQAMRGVWGERSKNRLGLTS